MTNISVPRESLERTIDRLQHGHEHDKAIRELRALLAQPAAQPAAQVTGEVREPASLPRTDSSIVPAGNPTTEDVLWNALMSCRSFLRSNGAATDRETALKDITEAVEFRRNHSVLATNQEQPE